MMTCLKFKFETQKKSHVKYPKQKTEVSLVALSTLPTKFPSQFLPLVGDITQFQFNIRSVPNRFSIISLGFGFYNS
ncbi:hypothetical protein ACET3Z_019910 [Daucus carota]